MEPRTYVTAIARGWIIVLVATLLGAAAGFGLSALRPATYEASSSGILAVSNVESGSDLWQTSNAAVVLAGSYADLATTPMVTQPAAEEVGDITPAQLAGRITASAPLESVNIDITAADADPERAAHIANATATALQDAIAEVAPKTPDNEPAVDLHITQEASAPSSPSGLSIGLLIAIGAVAGLGIGIIIALLRAPADATAPATRDGKIDRP